MRETFEFRDETENYLSPAIATSEGINLAKKQKSIHFPEELLLERIEHVLEEEIPDELEFSSIHPESHYSRLVVEHGLSEPESLLLSMALASTFMPEVFSSLLQASGDSDLNTHIGGFFMKGTPLFHPTVRTAVFLLAGRDLEKRARYTAFFHSRQTIFTSGLVTALPRHPSAVFLDYQLIFNASFWVLSSRENCQDWMEILGFR